MSLMRIYVEGEPVLRTKATRIRHADKSLRKLADDMFETMLHAPGVGLAAPQVGISRRLIVVHVPENYDGEENPEHNFRLINPEVIRGLGRQVGPEGCLSIPGWIADVPRHETVTVKAIDMENRPIRIKARGHLARVLQHEIDHLDGILFLDRVEDKSTIQQVREEVYEEVAE